MRRFDYIKQPETLLTPEIVQMIASIHEHKGKQELFLEANIDELKTLLYQRVKEIHTTRFPYNDFLFQHYDEITTDEES